MLLDLVPLAGRCRWQLECPPRPEPRRGRSAAGRHCHCHVEAPARRTFCWSIGLSGWQFAPRPRSDSESPIPASADPRAVCSGHEFRRARQRGNRRLGDLGHTGQARHGPGRRPGHLRPWPMGAECRTGLGPLACERRPGGRVAMHVPHSVAGSLSGSWLGLAAVRP